MNDSPTYAQLDRLHGWFLISYEELERLTFDQARKLIGEVYGADMSPETMAALRQRVIEMMDRQRVSR